LIRILPKGFFEELHSRLKNFYGEKNPSLPDPTEELISTILSQNTNDRNRDLAFTNLRSRFSSWESVAFAPLPELESAIRVAGLAPSKGPRIQKVLRLISEKYGQFSLPSQARPEELLDFLLSLPGVGPKTARCVLLFSYGYPVFPVDTHILRVGKRLGFIKEKESPARAMGKLDRLIPAGLHLSLHLLLIEHGRKTCRPRPLCGVCPLRDICSFYRKIPSSTPGKA
jgi:endonuclease-3